MSRIATAALMIVSPVLLAGCATANEEYPSLAIRDVERVQGRFETGEPARLDIAPVETAFDGPLPETLAGLVDQAAEAHEEFTSVQPRAAQLVAAARGSGVGSDSWAAAQVALAELDSARSQASIALGDLDTLYVAARTAAEEANAIETARNRVITFVAEEDAVLANLRADLQ
jgi:hypothetical protein